ncbi:MAG: gamma-glutamylcyclotransferase [Alphaproteobacteria bacterium]|nr:gamma-glutamylcyclotransferase [Alphaproteobacteria bacterium]
MDDGSVWYFAYGSNMNPARLKERCSDKGAPVLERIAGRLPGWRLEFNKQRLNRPEEGAANVVTDKDGQVEGTLNRMPSAGLDLLDVDEGVARGQYRRHAIRVQRADSGDWVDATMYVALPAVVAPNLRPPRWYLEHLLAGRDLLSADYYARLAGVATAD